MTATDVWSRVEIAQGDITNFEVDAIVNAANPALSGGGGVDGAIHRAAGRDELQAACRKLGGCATGEARITPGFRLRASYIVHTVGPVYRDGLHGEPDLLASCYRRSLEVAAQHGARTIAFPAISTGIFGYPFEAATLVALRAVREALAGGVQMERVILVFFGGDDYQRAWEIAQRLRTS